MHKVYSTTPKKGPHHTFYYLIMPNFWPYCHYKATTRPWWIAIYKGSTRGGRLKVVSFCVGTAFIVMLAGYIHSS